MPSYELIVDAVSGNEEAMEKILQIYAIEEESRRDEDMRQEITLALIDAIQHYDLNDPAKNEAYHRENYPDDTE